MAFTSAERDRRWERARGLMADRGWEAMLVTGEDGLCGGNLRYLADFRPVKGRSLLLLPLEGEPVLWVEHRVHELSESPSMAASRTRAPRQKELLWPEVIPAVRYTEEPPAVLRPGREHR